MVLFYFVLLLSLKITEGNEILEGENGKFKYFEKWYNFFIKSKRQNKRKTTMDFLSPHNLESVGGIYVSRRNHKIKSKIAQMCCPKAK